MDVGHANKNVNFREHASFNSNMQLLKLPLVLPCQGRVIEFTVCFQGSVFLAAVDFDVNYLLVFCPEFPGLVNLGIGRGLSNL